MLADNRKAAGVFIRRKECRLFRNTTQKIESSRIYWCYPRSIVTTGYAKSIVV